MLLAADWFQTLKLKCTTIYRKIFLHINIHKNIYIYMQIAHTHTSYARRFGEWDLKSFFTFLFYSESRITRCRRWLLRCGYRPWNVYSRLNWCDLWWQYVSIWLDDVCLTLAVMPDVQCLWFTDWIFSLFLHFTKPDRKTDQLSEIR